ncbi:MAG: GNAT family N-acetyltransferase [Actinomycetota bacterium]
MAFEQLAHQTSHSLLWAASLPESTGKEFRVIHEYVVVVREPGKAPPSDCKVFEDASRRPAQLAQLLCDAHQEPRALDYFFELLHDRKCIWIANDGGACVLRPGFGLMGLYELAVASEARRSGVGRFLVTTALRVAAAANLPLLAHAAPTESAKALFRSLGFSFVFTDRFHLVTSAASTSTAAPPAREGESSA